MKALIDFIQTADDRDWLHGLRVQARVVSALMVRDAMSRFGHDNLGFFWIIGEPMLLMIGVMVLWTIMGETKGHSDVSVIPFALTGYAFITLWRHIVARSMHCMTHSASLIFHRNVSFFDVQIARGVLECVAILSAFFVTYLPFALLDLAPKINDPLLLMGGWLFTTIFSMSFGLIVAGLTELSDAADRIITPLLYITLPFTGLFYMVDWLPASAQKIIVWSPMVSGIEMFRAGMFPPSVNTHYFPVYMVGWCVGMTAVGLPLFLYAQRHVRL